MPNEKDKQKSRNREESSDIAGPFSLFKIVWFESAGIPDHDINITQQSGNCIGRGTQKY